MNPVRSLSVRNRDMQKRYQSNGQAGIKHKQKESANTFFLPKTSNGVRPPICHVCGGSDSDFFTEKNGCMLYKCQGCGLMFVDPLPVSTEELYSQDYFSGAVAGFGYVNYDEDKEPMVPAFLKYLGLISSELGGSKGRLLDVGAATGFFVRLAKTAGFDALGIEISDHAAALGRGKGLPIQTGTLADVEGSFDCITMLDLIEHVPNPRAEITCAAARLRKHGVLVINTPDSGSMFARMMGKRWHLICPPEHLYYFNRHNIKQLLEEAGFTVVLETTIGKSFTVKYIFKTLHRWTSLAPFGRLADLFGRKSLSHVSVPVNLRDNMFVLARRR
ncbi:hypothetical protein A2851_02260 [Candidatus Kaiserbacteria bacterium RIFCSPHIGHO2_01_FULL_53_29]|uniref:Methyltransferase type 11 domain-containing protein n=1 Tax=Candidatus Kaiserbacteria bacterium RIFCSPHIGHO2_01_FULL_53_29 TaxID=1798480 RepID=A0A1F6CWX0_9BACT|nr:MAG: hypothetical protein A2851_02260 [Candidatus Kaiserbacteria bacterium RIFCSPHIGHO2_01_FULL_53_29]